MNQLAEVATKAPGMGLEKLYTLEQVAEYLHTPVATVKYWRYMGKIPVIKVGRQVLVEEAELAKFVAAGRQKAPSEWVGALQKKVANGTA